MKLLDRIKSKRTTAKLTEEERKEAIAYFEEKVKQEDEEIQQLEELLAIKKADYNAKYKRKRKTG